LRSIRKQLTVWLLASLFVLIAISGVVTYALLRRSLTAEYDRGLLAKARALATLTEEGPGGNIEFEFHDEYMPEFELGKKREYFEIWLANGRVLERSHSLESRDLPRQAGTFDKPVFWDVSLPDGCRGRAVGFAFIPQAEEKDKPRAEDKVPRGEIGQRVTLVLARSREDLNRTLYLLSVGMGGAGLLLPVGIALVVVALVGRGLRPLASVAAQVASIDSANLQHRFPDSQMPDELQPICRRLNELLQRLEEAFVRERRFTSNAAHELRTPIAELRTLTEVALLHAEDAKLGRDTIAEALAVAQQMERLVTTLLTLARGQSGAEHVTRERVALGEMLRAAWKPLQEAASNRSIAVNWEVSPVADVEADPALLRAILSNLFSNAVTFCPERGQITVRTANRNDSVHLLVANTNSSLRGDDIPYMFEPFWQKDSSRTDPTHSGLGLSIVAQFCGLMNVGVEARLTDDDQVAIELTFRQPDPAIQ